MGLLGSTAGGTNIEEVSDGGSARSAGTFHFSCSGNDSSVLATVRNLSPCRTVARIFKETQPDFRERFQYEGKKVGYTCLRS